MDASLVDPMCIRCFSTRQKPECRECKRIKTRQVSKMKQQIRQKETRLRQLTRNIDTIDKKIVRLRARCQKYIKSDACEQLRIQEQSMLKMVEERNTLILMIKELTNSTAVQLTKLENIKHIIGHP